MDDIDEKLDLYIYDRSDSLDWLDRLDKVDVLDGLLMITVRQAYNIYIHTDRFGLDELDGFWIRWIRWIW